MKKLALGLLLALSTLSGCVIEAYPAPYRYHYHSCEGYYYTYSYERRTYIRVWCPSPGRHHHYRH